MKKSIWTAALALILLAAAPLKAQQKENLKQIEDYLNNIKTMQAAFVQTASNGNTAEGMLYIAKPNKIRMEYNPPADVQIIGDGDYIVYYDKELDQVTNIDYDDIPASLILANDVKLDGKKFKVSNYYHDAGITTVTIQYKDKGDIGPITLTFNNNPFELKQWSIVDPQSVEVTVSLYNAQKDIDLDKSLFKFKKAKSGPKSYNKGRR
ncbi:MAG: outer-membrane lipoprotein carrier protein LolA [Alphaproteobacteria bacterium]|nr:outer-membrane lipoprotein carrier protein LolA [Alphaproteobacteria bacterium]